MCYRLACGRKHAFTLIELLIVVAIIGILAAIAVPNFLNAQVRSRIARVLAEQRTLAGALDNYMLDNNGLPPERATSANDYRGYKYLTTPIAYINTILADPFGLKNASGGGDDLDSFYEFFVTRRGGSINNMYNIECVGPDGFDDFQPTSGYPAHAASFDFYEGSNGLRSKGDILRAGGVYTPRWYRERRGGPATVGPEWM